MTNLTPKHQEEAREWRDWAKDEFDVVGNSDDLIRQAILDNYKTALRDSGYYASQLIEARTALSSRDQEIKEVLEGLRNGENCWCRWQSPSTTSTVHERRCVVARGLWERVSEKGHEHGGIQPKP